MLAAETNRRRFLAFLAGSPLFAQEPGILANPKDALNVLDFEATARQKIPPAHFGYMATGVDDDATIKANREGFRHIQLRPRRLVDVTNVDLRVNLFGRTWDTPVALAPVGSQRAFHPEGEIAAARAAGSKKTLQILSTMTTTPIEEVRDANGQPIWYQLYATNRWEVTEKLVKRAESAGCPVLVFTVDLLAGSNRETLNRSRRTDTRTCVNCHSGAPGAMFSRKRMFDGIDAKGLSTTSPAADWETVRRLKKLTKMRLVVKGIETAEDARLCLENGVDGISVSNHGGRAEESGRGTIECLPEVVEAVGGKIPVLIDGGFRRGTDVYKALALGANAVCIGRPYIWGLGAFGQPGVESVLDILRRELELTMRQCGARSLAEISRSSVILGARG
jgi:4-hydroxymandelate oxidase